MTEIWYVEDFLSGQVLENKYFSTQREAAEFRNRLGYGIVLSHQFADGGPIPPRDHSRLIGFR